ncbi:MAG: hypothetical protein N3A72_11515 [bacterium]|nr:hypothetical protein [bacterium]
MEFNKLIKIIVGFGLLGIGSGAIGKPIVIQPWQKEPILLPVVSTTFKQTANSAQLRLLTKYYAVEQAYTELNAFILALPIDSTRTIQTILEKRPQCIPAIDRAVRTKSVITGFEYTSDSSAQITIMLEPKVIIDILGSYMKPEKPPKPIESEKPKKSKKIKSETVKKGNTDNENNLSLKQTQSSSTTATVLPTQPDDKKEKLSPKNSATP